MKNVILARADGLKPGDVLLSGGFYSNRTIKGTRHADGSVFLTFADGLRTCYDFRHNFEILRPERPTVCATCGTVDCGHGTGE